MGEHDTTSFELLLSDTTFRALLKRARDDYLSWDQFLEMQLPAALSPRRTWAILQELLASEAMRFPTPAPDSPQYWYTRTNRMNHLLSQIDRTCGVDSALHVRLRSAAGRPFLRRAQVEEAVAEAVIDGIDISREAATRLLRLEGSARSDAGRLVRNALTAAHRLGDYIDRPCSSSLMNELRSQLLEGLPQQRIKPAPRIAATLEPRHLEYGENLDADARAAYVCDLANGETGEPYEHHALRALLISIAMQVQAPLPDMNNQVGRLLFQLYCMKHGLPVLGLLPLARAKLAWERSEPPFDEPSMQWARGPREHESDYDGTRFLSLQLTLVVHELRRLETDMHDAESLDREILAGLSRDRRFNHRQRLLIGQALQDPEAEFRIVLHRTTHGITYATARKDLLGLTSAGLLECQTRGRGFVFVPVADLATMIERDRANA